MVEAIIKELELRKDYLQGEEVATIYFGGGTPSLLEQQELTAIFSTLEKHYKLASDLEITLEANPDDLYADKLKMLKDSPVNRLSIGIQSFSEEDLKFMNRAHDAKEAHTCIEDALKFGFENLTVDLIYGSPTTTDQQWQSNMQQVFDFGIPHISCYNLTVEPGTALDHFVRHKKAAAVDEEQSARQLEQLLDASAKAGYEHYEISNFAKPGWYSRHNSAYWQGKPYLGVGPSAHSFDGSSRRWNSANNQNYLKGLAEHSVPHEVEVLTPVQRYNEYLMTGLRTMWGCNLEHIASIDPGFSTIFKTAVKPYLEQGTIQEKDAVFTLSTKGKFLADRIAMELFMEED